MKQFRSITYFQLQNFILLIFIVEFLILNAK